MAGFYRVNYDENNWQKIIRQLKTNSKVYTFKIWNLFKISYLFGLICTKQISSKTKAQLISDAFSLAQSNQINPVIPLILSTFLSEETDYLPWKVFLNRIKFYTDNLESTGVNVFLNRYLVKLVELYYNKLGWSENKNSSWTDRYFLRFKKWIRFVVFLISSIILD